MTCRLPAPRNTLMTQLIQAVYDLRNTPFPGASPETIYAQFNALYPGVSTLEAITQQLRQGARKGIFQRCEYPAYSQSFHYLFNPEMNVSNWSNRQYGIPLLMDRSTSGSAYMTGCRNGPLAMQCPNKGQAGPNYQGCCVDTPESVFYGETLPLAYRLKQQRLRATLQSCCSQ